MMDITGKQWSAARADAGYAYAPLQSMQNSARRIEQQRSAESENRANSRRETDSQSHPSQRKDAREWQRRRQMTLR